MKTWLIIFAFGYSPVWSQVEGALRPPFQIHPTLVSEAGAEQPHQINWLPGLAMDRSIGSLQVFNWHGIQALSGLRLQYFESRSRLKTNLSMLRNSLFSQFSIGLGYSLRWSPHQLSCASFSYLHQSLQPAQWHINWTHRWNHPHFDIASQWEYLHPRVARLKETVIWIPTLPSIQVFVCYYRIERRELMGGFVFKNQSDRVVLGGGLTSDSQFIQWSRSYQRLILSLAVWRHYALGYSPQTTAAWIP
ncbi:MAG TPA: hypothetical protein VFV37_04730 [Luteibaculaceae bacterium]|nr:hypothetical protein [Luteibaculaceae bacterium]